MSGCWAAGLLGSPSFEIPRTVQRDARFAHLASGDQLRRGLAPKNKYNLRTAGLFLLALAAPPPRKDVELAAWPGPLFCAVTSVLSHSLAEYIWPIFGEFPKISSAILARTNGFGLSFHAPIQARMPASRH